MSAGEGRGADPIGWDRSAVWRILCGSGAASGATAIALLCHFASVTLIARLVEKDVFGTYILVLAAAQGTKVLGGLGLDATLARRLAREDTPARAASFAHVSMLRVLGISAACVLLIVTGDRLDWLGVGLLGHVGYVVAIAAAGSGQELLLAALQGMFEFGRYTFGVVLPAALRLGGIAVLYAAGRGELVDLLRLEIALLALSLVLVLGLSSIRRLIRGWNLQLGLVRELLSFSAPLYANSITYFLSVRLNLFFLAGLTNPAHVAHYGAAGQVPDGCARLFHALVVAYFPFAAKLFGDADRQGATRLTEFALALAAFGNMLLVVVAALFGPGLLVALFGERYRPAAAIFALLMAGYWVQSLISVMGYSLVAAGHPGVTTKINCVGALLLLAGGLAAIPAFGAVGAAGALVAASAVVLALNWRAILRRGLHVGGATFLTPLALGLLAISLSDVLAVDSIIGRLAVIGLYVLICGTLVGELRASIRFLVREGRLLLRPLRTVP